MSCLELVVVCGLVFYTCSCQSRLRIWTGGEVLYLPNYSLMPKKKRHCAEIKQYVCIYIGYNHWGRFCTCQMMCKKQRSLAEIDKYENQRNLKFKPRLLKKFLWEVTLSDNLERGQKFFIDFVPQRISWWMRAQLLLYGYMHDLICAHKVKSNLQLILQVNTKVAKLYLQ